MRVREHVRVWVDPPTPPAIPVLAPLRNDVEPPLTQLFRATLGGGRCTVLIDPGASHVYASRDLVARLGMSVRPST
jgi:hypothetical protein